MGISLHNRLLGVAICTILFISGIIEKSKFYLRKFLETREENQGIMVVYKLRGVICIFSVAFICNFLPINSLWLVIVSFIVCDIFLNVDIGM